MSHDTLQTNDNETLNIVNTTENVLLYDVLYIMYI